MGHPIIELAALHKSKIVSITLPVVGFHHQNARPTSGSGGPTSDRAEEAGRHGDIATFSVGSLLRPGFLFR
jgi:hypothetical protein